MRVGRRWSGPPAAGQQGFLLGLFDPNASLSALVASSPPPTRYTGVLQIEAMAQLGGIAMLDPSDTAAKNQFFFGGIEGCRFRRHVVPGDTLVRSAGGGALSAGPAAARPPPLPRRSTTSISSRSRTGRPYFERACSLLRRRPLGRRAASAWSPRP